MGYTIIFVLLGYLSGSLMFARMMLPLFHKKNGLEQSKDGNPGAANAFLYGGAVCGALTLLGDLAKGCLPVYLFMHLLPNEVNPLSLALVLAAPVLGHAYPIFFRFQGGKGIATSFGCMLGLLTDYRPLLILAISFLFFSLVVCIQPHFYRTIIAFFVALIGIALFEKSLGVTFGFLLICCIVCLRMHQSKEKRESMKVGFLWKH